ncbi:hypothetical protein FBY20_4088 [Achromobacter sp. SLBN-14]|nr:hypothetical protein FBY20_4088 [Achromobacter sp. SLBN-14]
MINSGYSWPQKKSHPEVALSCLRSASWWAKVYGALTETELSENSSFHRKALGLHVLAFGCVLLVLAKLN